MEKKEFLTEENYHRTNEKVKRIGKILIIVGLCLGGLGIIFLLSGFFGVGNQIFNGIQNGQSGVNGSSIFAGFGSFAIGGILLLPSVPVTIIGLIMRFLIGNGREIASYTTQQTMPIVQEGMEKMAPSRGRAKATIAKETAPAYGSIAKEIAKGIKEGLKDEEK